MTWILVVLAFRMNSWKEVRDIDVRAIYNLPDKQTCQELGKAIDSIDPRQVRTYCIGPTVPAKEVERIP